MKIFLALVFLVQPIFADTCAGYKIDSAPKCQDGVEAMAANGFARPDRKVCQIGFSCNNSCHYLVSEDGKNSTWLCALPGKLRGYASKDQYVECPLQIDCTKKSFLQLRYPGSCQFCNVDPEGKSDTCSPYTKSNVTDYPFFAKVMDDFKFNTESSCLEKLNSQSSEIGAQPLMPEQAPAF